MYEFAYRKVSSVDDAVAAMQKAEDGKFVAGGQTMLPTMKHRLASPSDLIDLGGIDALSGISCRWRYCDNWRHDNPCDGGCLGGCAGSDSRVGTAGG